MMFANPEPLSPLEGELDPNHWDFMAAHGPLPNPVGHTFPLLAHDSDGLWRLVGTGFYVSGSGLFVTAAHNIEDVLTDDQQVQPLAILELCAEGGLFGPQEFRIRPIVQCWLGHPPDIALGAAALRTGEGVPWTWPLSWEIPEVHQNALTYAFPNHLLRRVGQVQSFHFRPAVYTELSTK
jgi:hypothetical protein